MLFSVLESRDYQTHTVDSIVARWRLGPCRIACVAPTGSGKTCLAQLIMARYPEQRWVFIAHTRDLVFQAAEAIGDCGIIMAGVAPNPFARIQVCSVQTLLARDYLPEGNVILDECFPGDTRVGEQRIDQICVGDWVQSVDHSTGMTQLRQVTKVFKKQASSLWRLRIGATVVHSTPSHPFFVKGRGYVEARNLLPGDLLCVWDYIHGENGERRAAPEDLLEGMYEQTSLPDHGIHQSSARGAKDAQAKPHAQKRGQGQGFSSAQIIWPSTEDTWRQRDRSNSTAEDIARGARLAMGSGVHLSNVDGSRTRLLDALQNRPRAPDTSDSDRGGRVFSRNDETPSSGQEEGEVLVWERLDRSESVECSSDGSTVYNLEVEGNHTYFANGILVHNCHHYTAEEWNAYVETLGSRNALGLTATPERADGVGLRGLFQDIIVAAHYSELIAGGFIVPARVLRPAKRLRGVAQDPVTAYLAKGEGRVGITFCRTVDIARDTAAKYAAFGVPAACIDFETEDRSAIQELGKSLQMLTCVYTLTEGVNIPAVSCVVLARGLGHQSALLQIAGRGLRAHPGKTDCLFLDLPGVTWELGLPHEDRDYSLDGITRKPSSLSLRVCQQCGYTEESGASVCGRCGFKLPPVDLRPRVHGVEIGEHAQHSDLEKTLRLSALISEAKRKGYQDDWVSQRYKAEYGKLPELPHDVGRKQEMYQKLKEQAARSGYSQAYAAARYKALYFCYPPRAW